MDCAIVIVWRAGDEFLHGNANPPAGGDVMIQVAVSLRGQEGDKVEVEVEVDMRIDKLI